MSQQTLFARPLDDAVAKAEQRMDYAIRAHKPEMVFAFWSGGNDSTVLAHVARRHAHLAVFIDTGIGLASTRRHVEITALDLGYWLLASRPPAPGEPNSYEHLVREVLGGFPGPAAHRYAWQRLKQRQWEALRRHWIGKDGRTKRVMFLTGIRMAESDRRMNRGSKQAVDREGAIVWVNPLIDWSNDEMRAYRRHHRLPSAPASQHIHMSGECLCGSMADPKVDELAQIELLMPDEAEVVARIRALEAEMTEAGVKRCRWGMGRLPGEGRERAGKLCDACELQLDVQ